MNKKKLIIFDFDGTIADSFSVLLSIINELSDEEGIARFSSEQITQARDLPMREVILQLKISRWKLPFLTRRIQAKFAQKIDKVRPIEGIISVLEKLKSAGNILGVLSSTQKEILDQFMRENKITAFTFVHSEKNLFGKAKILKKILKEYALAPSEAVYVGDESRDIDAAKEAGLEMVAVSWGFNSKKMLAGHQPDFLINQPEELLKILV
jgi:phosphoglycolate phosphatase-like HAD superfamily hydrolase